jgi:hypothetical protein
MDTRSRGSYCVFGSLIPLLVNLYLADYTHVFQVFQTTGVEPIVGFTVRAAIIVVFGIAIAKMHPHENNPARLVYLGLGAPALFLGLANGLSAKQAMLYDLSFTSDAYALEQLTQEGAQAFPQAGGGFFQGITGIYTTRYVIVVGSSANSEKAKGMAKQFEPYANKINQALYIFPPIRSAAYGIMLGSVASSPKDAADLLAQAKAAGLPSDSFIWALSEQDAKQIDSKRTIAPPAN